MKASIVDLRYKMNDILKALERNERVTILYHGKVKGIISPDNSIKNINVKDHPFFGMMKKQKKTVLELMEEIRGDRFNAV